LWPYSASDSVNRARNSEPAKMAVNLNMQFVDMWWRFATVPAQEIALRMWQNIANGGALTFEVNGTLDLQDRQALEAAKPVFRWAAANERYYAGEESAARVLLLGGVQNTGRTYPIEPYRGMFRLLSEEHIPFAVSDNMAWIGKRTFDLVVTTNWAPKELLPYVESGGRLLVISPSPPEFPVADVAAPAKDVKGYLRIRDHTQFPSLKDTDLLMLDGAFTEVRTSGPPALTLVPPSMIGPPELVHVDQHDTDVPGIVTKQIGRGVVTWIPWDLGRLYYRLSLPAHAFFFRDVIDRMNPERQLKTNAHPLVEMTLMRQAGQTLVHLINLTGTSQTGYYSPVPMQNIRVQVAGTFNHASTVRNSADLPVRTSGRYTEFVVPQLSDYELVVLK
jgi:hypothetical protein